MSRLVAGGAVTLLLTTGAFLFWQGHAADRPALPPEPTPSASPTNAGFAMLSAQMPRAPEATAKTREEKRFGRADKDKDGRITTEELFAPRRKAFAKLDIDRNGTLSFDEWGARTINKFKGADDDRDGSLTAAEYADTAPKTRGRSVRCAA